MSKEEAERQQQSRSMGAASADTTKSSQGLQDLSAERTMQAAEKQATKGGPEPQVGTLSTMQDPTDTSSPGGASTLPVVEEVGEAGSTEGQSRRSLTNHEPPPLEKDGDAVTSGNGQGIADASCSGKNSQRPASPKGKGKEKEHVRERGRRLFQFRR